MYRFLSCFSLEKGSVMVEFALVSMVLIIILAGIIQFGLIFNTQLSLENAASTGARYISMPVSRTDSDINTYIETLVPSIPLQASNINITPAVRQRGQAFTVTITYNYPIPVTIGVFPNQYTLSAASVAMQQ